MSYKTKDLKTLLTKTVVDVEKTKKSKKSTKNIFQHSIPTVKIKIIKPFSD